MSKDTERKTARILFVEQGKTAKDIAELVGVSEKTISIWANKYAWKSARTAQITSHDNRIQNIKQLIDSFAQNRLDLQTELADILKSGGDKEREQGIRQEMARIDSGVANWNKTLENVDKGNKIQLSTYLNVMDRIFKALNKFDTKLYLQTVTFQEQHVNEIAQEIG